MMDAMLLLFIKWFTSFKEMKNNNANFSFVFQQRTWDVILSCSRNFYFVVLFWNFWRNLRKYFQLPLVDTNYLCCVAYVWLSYSTRCRRVVVASGKNSFSLLLYIRPISSVYFYNNWATLLQQMNYVIVSKIVRIR